jgi:hypothetical protein
MLTVIMTTEDLEANSVLLWLDVTVLSGYCIMKERLKFSLSML